MYYIQSSLRLFCRLSRSTLVLGKTQTDAVHTVTLISGGRISFTLEDMAEMTSTVIADDLGALHAKGIVHMSLHSTGNRIKVSGPATTGLELVIGCVKRRITPGAVVHALGRMVLIVLAGTGAFCALLTKNAELFWTNR